jgi:MATE family multidrug resistance protein
MTSRLTGWRADARATVALAWPVLVGQLAVLGFMTIDTLIAARLGADELATLALSLASYSTVFIGLMGLVLALSPIVGQLYGAGRPEDAGHQLHQAVWLALAASLPGCALLLWPEPLLALAQAGPDVADHVHRYLAVLAAGLPAALLFAAFRSFSTAVSRPKAVMRLQLIGFAAKLPLSALLVFGIDVPGGAHLPALGVTGCALATSLVLWGQVGMAAWLLRRDAFYAPFRAPGRHRLRPPHRGALAAQLRLGMPIAGSMLIESTAFTFMAVFIARLGTAALAGHQIAANVAALMFMMPLALGNAASTLVAQAIGGGRLTDARRIGRHGVALGAGVAAVAGALLWVARPAVVALYGGNTEVAAVALPLLGWVALFHLGDACQAMAAAVLRAWRIASVPMLVYAVALWGVGLGGGWWLVRSEQAWIPAGLGGAGGYWMAATAGLWLAALALLAWLRSTSQRSVLTEQTKRAVARPAAG